MPRHPPYALSYLITLYPNLMRFLLFEIFFLSYFFSSKNKTTLSSFQRTFERIFILSKLSKTFFSTFFSFVFFFLHRKEVIHPHVLVGIPCYDFTPITCPTLNGPIQINGLATDFRYYKLPWRDGRCVQHP